MAQRVILVLATVLLGLMSAKAQEAPAPQIPMLWDVRERLPKPDLSGLERLRFLTTTDFAPFNFVDASGRLSGFHVDLARAICRELELTQRCEIQALPWEELDAALKAGNGEALLSGLAITPEARAGHLFSRPYLKFPARFASLRGTALDISRAGLTGKRIAVIAGSAHERMAKAYFPEAQAAPYPSFDGVTKALVDKQVDVVFGDGLTVGSWLADSAGSACCAFAGGPYLAPEYLGYGLAVAVAPSRDDLRRAMDYALHALNVDGTFAELYLRYFPVGFF